MNRVNVIGLGYIGLPTAAMFATNGVRVIGVDVSTRVVDTLRSGSIHIEEPGLEAKVRAAINSGMLDIRATPEEGDAFIIAVPTPHHADHSPDLRFVEAAAAAIVPVLRPGNVVILESTSPPGTTESLVPILEQSGLTAHTDFHVAYSPERVLPGRILQELVENDRVIGGVTPAAAEAGAALYRSFVKGGIHLTDASTAEMAKLMENTYRDVNIALANEFSRIGARLGIDTFVAIEMANHHPRVNILRPGPGVGGHCIAVDPWFIVHSAPEEAQLVRTARQVNDQQPAHVARLVEAVVGQSPPAVIALLGVTYKANIDDVRESPSVTVANLLSEAGHHLRLHDAHAKTLLDGTPLESDLAAVLKDADALLILTDHDEYRQMDPADPMFSYMARRLVIDTRHCIDRWIWEAAGFEVHQLGVGALSPATAGVDAP